MRNMDRFMKGLLIAIAIAVVFWLALAWLLF